MKKLLITLLAMSSLSAYSMNMDMMGLSYSAELKTGMRMFNYERGERRESTALALLSSVGASYKLTKSQMISVNLGIVSLPLNSVFFVPKDVALKFMVASLEVEYSYMISKTNDSEFSVTPSVVVLTDGDINNTDLEVGVAVTRVRHIRDNLYLQYELDLRAHKIVKKDILGFFLQPSIGLKWLL